MAGGAGGRELILMNKPNWLLSTISLAIIPRWNSANPCELVTGNPYFAGDQEMQDKSECLNWEAEGDSGYQ